MEIPSNTIKVGYRDIEIEKSKGSFYKENNYGEFDHKKNKIEINTEIDNLELANTLFHETMHAAMWVGGLSSGDTPIVGEKQEEQIVTILSNSFIGIIRDNPWFLPFIQQCIGENNNDTTN